MPCSQASGSWTGLLFSWPARYRRAGVAAIHGGWVGYRGVRYDAGCGPVTCRQQDVAANVALWYHRHQAVTCVTYPLAFVRIPSDLWKHREIVVAADGSLLRGRQQCKFPSMSVNGSSDLIGRAPGGRKLIAVVYADMVGYSRLVELDDLGTVQRLQTLRSDLVDPAIDEHGGRLVQTGGDSL